MRQRARRDTHLKLARECGDDASISRISTGKIHFQCVHVSFKSFLTNLNMIIYLEFNEISRKPLCPSARNGYSEHFHTLGYYAKNLTEKVVYHEYEISRICNISRVKYLKCKPQMLPILQ